MRRIAVRAVIVHDDKLLLVRQAPYRDGLKKDFYCTIGGGLDEGEGVIDGLKREVLEETGVEPEVGRLLFVQQYRDEIEHIEFFFHVTNGSDFLNIDLADSTHGELEIEEIGFFDSSGVTILPTFLQDIAPSEIAKIDSVRFFNYL
jgi:ADP-ribose pyrophosphatase YjhB (NUDIX family)